MIVVGTATNIIELPERICKVGEQNRSPTLNRLGTVNIRRGIFQEDSLSPLLFVVALITVTKIFRTLEQEYSFGKGKEMLNDLDDFKLYGRQWQWEWGQPSESSKDQVWRHTGMQFGFDKCAVLKMKSGNQVHCDEFLI